MVDGRESRHHDGAGAQLRLQFVQCYGRPGLDKGPEQILVRLQNRTTVAACRIELPPSTARTIRSRRSWDNGAVMARLHAHAPQHLGIRTSDSVQSQTALNTSN